MRLLTYHLPFCLIALSAVCRPPQTNNAPTLFTSSVKQDYPMIAKDSSFPIEYLTGKFDPAHHPDFERIPAALCDKKNLFLRKDALRAFEKMWHEARRHGIKLVIRSATRNFDNQKAIWEAKWTGNRLLSSGENARLTFPDPQTRALEILKFSSMPGTSRHHWGTDIDLNAFTNAYFEKGEGLALFNWLTEHAHKFGFYRPYTLKSQERPTGYEEEKWHWSYFPVADALLMAAKDNLKNEHISGFKGSETATKIDIIEKYVLGVQKSPNSKE